MRRWSTISQHDMSLGSLSPHLAEHALPSGPWADNTKQKASKVMVFNEESPFERKPLALDCSNHQKEAYNKMLPLFGKRRCNTFWKERPSSNTQILHLPLPSMWRSVLQNEPDEFDGFGGFLLLVCWVGCAFLTNPTMVKGVKLSKINGWARL